MAGQVTRAVFDLYPRAEAESLLIAAGEVEYRIGFQHVGDFTRRVASMLKLLPRDLRMRTACRALRPRLSLVKEPVTFAGYDEQQVEADRRPLRR